MSILRLHERCKLLTQNQGPTRWSIILISLLPFGAASCQSSVELVTNPPGLEVVIGDKVIGKSPIVLDSTNLALAKSDAGYVMRLRQMLTADTGPQGADMPSAPTAKLVPAAQAPYEMVLVVPERYGSLRVELNVEPFLAAGRSALSANKPPLPAIVKDNPERRRRLDQDSADLLRLQFLVYQGKAINPQLMPTLRRIEKDRPGGGSAAFLQAISMYLDGDSVGANAALQRAAAANTGDVDFRIVLSELQALAKGKKPSAGEVSR